jgi:hypothetical protein
MSMLNLNSYSLQSMFLELVSQHTIYPYLSLTLQMSTKAILDKGNILTIISSFPPE